MIWDYKLWLCFRVFKDGYLLDMNIKLFKDDYYKILHLFLSLLILLNSEMDTYSVFLY